jgi:hypothetical protein
MESVANGAALQECRDLDLKAKEFFPRFKMKKSGTEEIAARSD